VDGVNSEMVVIQQSEQGTGVVLAKSSCARVLKHIAAVVAIVIASVS
jgi:hypothetical protein